MFFYMKLLFLWLRQFSWLKSRYGKQDCILHDKLHVWGHAMNTNKSKSYYKRMQFCVECNQECNWAQPCLAPVRILATANTQFGQEMALVMQTMHTQRWQYPDRVDKRCVFFHWKCTQVLQNSLSIKRTCIKRYHHYLLRHLVAF